MSPHSVVWWLTSRQTEGCWSLTGLREGVEWYHALTKQLDIDFLKCVNAAELVKLMMDLVEDEGLVIVCSIVLHYIIHCGQGEGAA